jgi:hypothetical protein
VDLMLQGAFILVSDCINLILYAATVPVVIIRESSDFSDVAG